MVGEQIFYQGKLVQTCGDVEVFDEFGRNLAFFGVDEGKGEAEEQNA